MIAETVARELDGRHQLPNDPKARESLAFMLQLPDEGIGGWAYAWVNPDNTAGTLLSLCGPGTAGGLDETHDNVPIPADLDFANWDVGPLKLRHRDPLRAAELVFSGDRATLEYEFEAVHEPYVWDRHLEPPPPFIASNRYEQAGLIKGVLHIDGREIQFDTTGHRDHSWGIRDWGGAQHYKWLGAQAGPDVAVQLWYTQGLGRSWLRGYVFKDGELSQLRHAEIEHALDSRFFQRSIDAVLYDESNRVTVVKGEPFGGSVWNFSHSTLTQNQSPLIVEIDGARGVGHLDMSWQAEYVDYVVNHASGWFESVVGDAGKEN